MLLSTPRRKVWRMNGNLVLAVVNYFLFLQKVIVGHFYQKQYLDLSICLCHLYCVSLEGHWTNSFQASSRRKEVHKWVWANSPGLEVLWSQPVFLKGVGWGHFHHVGCAGSSQAWLQPGNRNRNPRWLWQLKSTSTHTHTHTHTPFLSRNCLLQLLLVPLDITAAHKRLLVVNAWDSLPVGWWSGDKAYMGYLGMLEHLPWWMQIGGEYSSSSPLLGTTWRHALHCLPVLPRGTELLLSTW